MSEKHSPLPWKLEKLVGKSDDDLSFVIAAAKGGHVTDFLSKADGELIIAAVNSHAALVEENKRLREACEALASAFDGKTKMSDMDAAEFVDRAGDTFSAVILARSALANPVQP